MRNGMGSFILGLGMGAFVGVVVNRWLESDRGNEFRNGQQSDINLDREKIADLAEQFIQSEERH